MNVTTDIPMIAGGSRLLPVLSAELALATEANGWFGRLLARRLGLPSADVGKAVGSLQIDIEPATVFASQCERWTRTFGDRTWASTLAPGPHDTVVEHTGLLTLEFAVHLDDRWNTHMTLRRICLASAPTPIARWLDIAAVIEPDGTTVVTVSALGGHCSYRAIPETPAVPARMHVEVAR